MRFNKWAQEAFAAFVCLTIGLLFGLVVLAWCCWPDINL